MSRVLSHKAGLASTKLINSSVLIIFSIAPQTTNSSKLKMKITELPRGKTTESYQDVKLSIYMRVPLTADTVFFSNHRIRLPVTRTERKYERVGSFPAYGG